MADFTNPIVSWWIIIGTLGGIIGCFWILWGNNIKKPEGEIKPTGHVWDEDLEEFDNPLPRWWTFMFLGTLVFGLIYLALYPGLGTFKGLLGWSEIGQYEAESQAYDAKYAATYQQYAGTPLAELASNPEAMKVGERLYASYCVVCHGSDARGAIGFPNLADKDWLWGGKPEQIKQSIAAGRVANMPAKGGNASFTDADVDNLTNYVLSLSGRQVDATSAGLGEAKYKTICIACHGMDGTGNPMLGAPNLTDDIWLYGSSKAAVATSIGQGRIGEMPAHQNFLGEEKVHLLAAYVYSLSQ